MARKSFVRLVDANSGYKYPVLVDPSMVTHITRATSTLGDRNAVAVFFIGGEVAIVEGGVDRVAAALRDDGAGHPSEGEEVGRG